MKTKTKIISGIFLLSILMFLGMALAVTSTTPTASEIVTGTYVFNATASVVNATNCTWATTAEGVFALTRNTSTSQTIFTNSTDTTTLTETASTTLNITCRNLTSIESTTLTIGIDNTNPTCSFTVDYDEITYLSAIGVATTQGSSDTTTLTYAWTLYDLTGNSQQTSTSSAPTFSGTDFDEKGEFTLGLTVTDGASKSTSCTNQSIFVRGSDDEPIIPIISQTITTGVTVDKRPYIVIGSVGLIMLIAVVAIIIISKSKKR